MADHHHPLAVLRHTVVDGVQQLRFDHVAQPLQLGHNLVEIPFVGVEQPADVLEQPQLRLQPFHRRDEDRKTIPGILQPQLKPAHAERLAGRPADDHLRRGQLRLRPEGFAMAFPFEVALISGAAVRLHLESDRRKSLRLESQREAPAAGEEIEHDGPPVFLRDQQPVQVVNVSRRHGLKKSPDEAVRQALLHFSHR